MPLKPITAMRKDRASAKGVKLQHRHFAFIASVIKDGLPHLTKEEKAMVVDAFAQALAKTNPNFDRARFFTAAGWADPIIEQAAYPDTPFAGGKGKTEPLFLDEFNVLTPEESAQAYDIIRKRDRK